MLYVSSYAEWYVPELAGLEKPASSDGTPMWSRNDV